MASALNVGSGGLSIRDCDEPEPARTIFGRSCDYIGQIGICHLGHDAPHASLEPSFVLRDSGIHAECPRQLSARRRLAFGEFEMSVSRE
jgi:hypothetical protein